MRYLHQLDTHVNDKDLWSKKNEICRFATWWRKKYKKTVPGNCWSDRLEIWYTVSLSKGEQNTMRTFAYLKNMAAIGQTNLNTY